MEVSTIIFYIVYFVLIVYFIYLFNVVSQENKVKKISEKYKKIIELNNNTKFETYKTNYYIKHYAKSKRSLEKTKLDDLVMYNIENNVDALASTVEIIKNNVEKYKEYEKKYEEVFNKENEENAISNTLFTLEKFKKIERRVVEKEKLKKKFDLLTVVEARYTSPKGNNSYCKKDNYDYNKVLEIYQKWQGNKKFRISSLIERSKMSDSIRYDVLKRDNYKCRICGASAEDGAKLHVDHIIPVSKGGKTELNNLQTLCERCNMGKSNKL